jgi:hypothetical protein
VVIGVSGWTKRCGSVRPSRHQGNTARAAMQGEGSDTAQWQSSHFNRQQHGKVDQPRKA